MTHMQFNEPPQPDYPPPANAPGGMATAALVVGIIAAFSGAAPVLGLLLGLAAIILGAMALRRKQSRRKSLTSLILGILASLTSIIVTVLLIAFGGNLLAALQDTNNWEFTESQESTVGEEDFLDSFESLAAQEPEAERGNKDQTPAPTAAPSPKANEGAIPWDAYNTGDAPLSTAAGTKDDPHRIGTRIVAGDWEIVINSFSDNATAEVMALEPKNPEPAAGYRYSLVNLTLNNLSDTPMKVIGQRISYDTSGQAFRPLGRTVKSPQPAMYESTKEITGNFTGYVAYRPADKRVGEFLTYEDDSLPKGNGYIALD